MTRKFNGKKLDALWDLGCFLRDLGIETGLDLLNARDDIIRQRDLAEESLHAKYYSDDD